MISKKVLVTGGTGFVGSHLCERLIKDGHQVICLDNNFTGSIENVKHLMPNPSFKLLIHDVILPISINVDEIYNLACPASPIHYQFDPIKTTKTSVIGVLNMLDLAMRTNAKILQASTSEVYGDPFNHPQEESYWGNVNPMGVRSCYDEGKRCAESLCWDYFNKKKVKVKVIRIFNTYGPNMNHNDGRVVSNFIIQALKGEDIVIFGKGNQTRSFQYIDDLIEAMIKMMNTEDSFIGPVNIGNPIETSVLELARQILDLTKSTSTIIFKTPLKDDPKQRCPNISLAKLKLNWLPKVKLEEGLIRTIEYFNSECLRE